jgi:NAD(P)-dependent dehydrogenase (short-subunit alcohol dehydrogenase family)
MPSIRRIGSFTRARIRVNVVCPGFIQTPMVDRSIQRGIYSQQAMNSYEQAGLVGKPTDIAEAVIWLCSEKAAYIMGHALAVDGGLCVSI